MVPKAGRALPGACIWLYTCAPHTRISLKELPDLSGHTFFFYGSLMDQELLEAVIDRKATHLSFRPGWLTGCVAETAHGYTFPTLVERAGARADGLITHGLTDGDIARIAYFEDTEYAPATVDVATADTGIAAQVYVATATLNSSGEPWHFDHWRHHHKPLLVAVTRRIMREHYGITPFEEIDAHWHRIKAELEAGMQTSTPKRRSKTRYPGNRTL